MPRICYEPIGVIHSPFKEQDETPIQSTFSAAPGTVEVFPEYAPGLKDLEGFSHIILLYHFHRAKPGPLLQRPFLDQGGERGVFAIRHYDRPNPIGLSIVGLKAIKGNVLEIAAIDVLDGTPLLDIKPYISKFDRPEHVRCGWFDERGVGSLKAESYTPGALREQK